MSVSRHAALNLRWRRACGCAARRGRDTCRCEDCAAFAAAIRPAALICRRSRRRSRRGSRGVRISSRAGSGHGVPAPAPACSRRARPASRSRRAGSQGGRRSGNRHGCHCRCHAVLPSDRAPARTGSAHEHGWGRGGARGRPRRRGRRRPGRQTGAAGAAQAGSRGMQATAHVATLSWPEIHPRRLQARVTRKLARACPGVPSRHPNRGAAGKRGSKAAPRRGRARGSTGGRRRANEIQRYCGHQCRNARRRAAQGAGQHRRLIRRKASCAGSAQALEHPETPARLQITPDVRPARAFNRRERRTHRKGGGANQVPAQRG